MTLSDQFCESCKAKLLVMMMIILMVMITKCYAQDFLLNRQTISLH